eukprot:scaffold261729_cov29-Tisochrysis_lutea.AAC.2
MKASQGGKKKGGDPAMAAKMAGMTKEEKERAKLVAKVVKEGGKKGVEIEGAADMGGLEFFCTTIESPDGESLSNPIFGLWKIGAKPLPNDSTSSNVAPKRIFPAQHKQYFPSADL